MLQKNKKCYNNNAGYVLLMSVLVIGAVSMTLAVTLLGISIDSSRDMVLASADKQSLSVAYGCIEETLQRIHDTVSYSGTDNFVLGNGACEINVQNVGTENNIIEVMGSAGDSIKKVKIYFDATTSTFAVTSMHIVSDF